MADGLTEGRWGWPRFAVFTSRPCAKSPAQPLVPRGFRGGSPQRAAPRILPLTAFNARAWKPFGALVTHQLSAVGCERRSRPLRAETRRLPLSLDRHPGTQSHRFSKNELQTERSACQIRKGGGLGVGAGWMDRELGDATPFYRPSSNCESATAFPTAFVTPRSSRTQKRRMRFTISSESNPSASPPQGFEETAAQQPLPNAIRGLGCSHAACRIP